jgi:putative transposase
MERSEFFIEMRRKEEIMTEIEPVQKDFSMTEDAGHGEIIAQNSQNGEMDLTEGCCLVHQSSAIDGQIAGQKTGLVDNFSGQNAEKLAIGGQEIGPEWLDLDGLSTLTGKSYSACTKDVQRGKFTVIKYVESRGGAGGKRPLIHITDPSIPPAAQVKWIQTNPDAARDMAGHIKDKLAPQAQWEITKLTAPVVAVSKEILLNEPAKERLSTKIELVQKALFVPAGWKKSRWVEKVAEDAGLTKQSLYRDIKIYKEGGIEALVKPREKKGPTAWDPEALEYMSGIYIKAIREGGDASKVFAYQAVIAKAKETGWRVGSSSSAYEHLGKLNALLEKYARGGNRALDNVFYILRQYKDLEPFECIVGDQHRFDFWVHDRELDRVLRMEGYFWLDLRTRAPYGISIADRYNSYMIGLAMRMGIKHWGKFQTAYTDNGKPETSKYTNSILNDLRAYGMQELDISELYKTNDGYAIEGNEECEVIDVVSTSQAWHRHARPYNAKAKLIERFFQTIERILLDLGVPGLVRELKGTSEEKALSDKRLKRLKEENKLLTPEEFTLKVFDSIDMYLHRRHSALKRSPMDEILYAVKNEGFTPRMMVESELDFVLMARDTRSVNRGRIHINNELYEGISLDHGLWDIKDGTRVEVRFDIYEDNVIAIRPDGAAVQLRRVPESSMKDKNLTSELMQWKREMIAKVKEQYKKLTAPIPGIIEYSAHTKAALNLKKAVKKAEPKMTDREYRESVDRIVAESSQPVRPKPMMLKRPVFTAEHDYYKWCVEAELNGYALPEQDIKFMGAYEAKMEESERIHWEEFRKFYHLDTEAVNERR